MRVGRKPVVLFGVAFLLAPLTLDAAPPAANRARNFSTVHTARTRVKGLKVASRLDPKATGGLTVDVEAHNPTRKTVTAELKVDVYSRRPSSPMARMLPMPVHHGSRILKVTLKPGARVAKKLLMKKGKTVGKRRVSRYFTAVRKAPVKRARARRSRLAQQQRVAAR